MALNTGSIRADEDITVTSISKIHIRESKHELEFWNNDVKIELRIPQPNKFEINIYDKTQNPEEKKQYTVAFDSVEFKGNLPESGKDTDDNSGSFNVNLHYGDRNNLVGDIAAKKNINMHFENADSLLPTVDEMILEAITIIFPVEARGSVRSFLKEYTVLPSQEYTQDINEPHYRRRKQ